MNSALQRARGTLKRPRPADPMSEEQRELLARYAKAFEEHEVETLVSLLHEDATMSMPPFAWWLNGRERIRAVLLVTRACEGDRLVPTQANGSPAFWQFRDGKPFALVVLTVRDGLIAELTSFLGAHRLAPLVGVHTWYDERGAGDTVVLLHGGLTDSRDFEPNLATLADRFRVLLPERRGHGHTADAPGPITIELMARDTAAFLDKIAGGPAHLVGYSAGAAVALRVAIERPELVDRLVLISGAFHRDGMIMLPSAEGTLPPPLVARYAEVSPDGADHFPTIIAKVARAAAEEPGLCREDLAGVVRPTLVMTGDDDLVTLDHTVQLHQSLPNAQLAILPATSHLLLFEKPELCTSLVAEFLTTEPHTLMPIRRA